MCVCGGGAVSLLIMLSPRFQLSCLYLTTPSLILAAAYVSVLIVQISLGLGASFGRMWDWGRVYSRLVR